MPKEWTHWILAEAAAKRAPEEIKEVIRGEPHLYLLGAVLPDTPYYFRGKGKSRGVPVRHIMSRAAGRMHGRDGENTLSFLQNAPLVLQAAAGDEDRSASGKRGLLSLMLGVAAHVYTDAAFHPMVFSFCGAEGDNVSPEAVSEGSGERHHYFETVLDLWYRKRAGDLDLDPGNAYRHSRSLRQVPIDIPAGFLAAYMEDKSTSGPPSESRMPQESLQLSRQALSDHARLQGRWENSFYAALFRGLDLLPGVDLGENAGLFYPVSAGRFSSVFFDKAIEFTDPAGCRPVKTTVAKLEAKALANMDRLFSVLIQSFQDRGPGSVPGTGILDELAGPSLTTGLPYTDRSPMRCFSVKSWQELFLRRKFLV
ncbi:MAG: zinc dependent phospholipase C family protein [Spirochaetales bacterium]|nr:zinc dependent phospholipase C family protein [Spirochaetales bacterium]MCF7938962.1 zinc dependent phospholipase C family protein [Spirochaetales bacterium]